ncbi:virion structural protein [Pseudomonas phage PhiPA3]|uniref:Virion structural protein n=1 Tax=Pseudomonas phage PhiPA3 TaxID=998086 RepID=F8SK27_BPPA3|nr:virion structural protein [Pseudomonas phage PhiPA3]AEH03577.1 virion structural protein [Pseudomonas phage PhiPA3]
MVTTTIESGITFLPLDLTGTAVTNRIVNESHTLTKVPGKNNRVFVCTHGGYYTNGFELRDNTGRALIRGRDYVMTYHYQQLTEMTGKGVYGLVVITDTTAVSPVRVSYQAVGGFFSVSADELKALLEKLTNSDALKITWEQIVGKPDAYAPADHRHELWQLYGMESMVTNLDRIGDAWALGRTALLSEARSYYTGYLQLAQQALDNYIARVNAHITDQNNPHQTDKVKIGLSFINNWPMATAAQTTNVNLDNVYMPIGGIYNMIQSMVIPALINHIRRQDNPHQLKLTDLNLYSTAQINALYAARLAKTQAAYNSKLFAGNNNYTLYMQPRLWLDMVNVDPGSIFSRDRFAPDIPGWGPRGLPTDFVWSGDNVFRYFPTVFEQWNNQSSNVYFVGSNSATSGPSNIYTRQGAEWAILNSNRIYIQDIPVGSHFVGTYLRNMNGGRYVPQFVIWRYNGGDRTSSNSYTAVL